MVKRGLITFIFCFHCAFATYPSEGGAAHGPASAEERILGETQSLRQDFASALLLASYPHAVGLEHFSASATLSQLSARVRALKSSSEEFIRSTSQIDVEIDLLTIYYDLLAKLYHLDSLQKGKAASVEPGELYITLDAQTVADWGGLDMAEELNSNPQSPYRLSAHEKGQRVEFKERFLLELQLHKISQESQKSQEDEEEKLLALAKILANEILVDGLAMVHVFAPEEVQEYDLDPSIRNMLDEKRASIEWERTLDGLIGNEEISAIFWITLWWVLN